MKVPAGTITVSPVSAAFSMAELIAGESICVPSPIAPQSLTFIALMPYVVEKMSVKHRISLFIIERKVFTIQKSPSNVAAAKISK